MGIKDYRYNGLLCRTEAIFLDIGLDIVYECYHKVSQPECYSESSDITMCSFVTSQIRSQKFYFSLSKQPEPHVTKSCDVNVMSHAWLKGFDANTLYVEIHFK